MTSASFVDFSGDKAPSITPRCTSRVLELTRRAAHNGSLLPTGLIKECDWLTAFACRIVYEAPRQSFALASQQRPSPAYPSFIQIPAVVTSGGEHGPISRYC